MATSAKEARKLFWQAKAAVGFAGGPFPGRSRKGGKGGGSCKKHMKQPGGLPPGFEKPKLAAGGQFGGERGPIQCIKCKETGHLAGKCPNKEGSPSGSSTFAE